MNIEHLTKDQRKEFFGALLSAFTLDSFEKMLLFGLDKTLQTFAGVGMSFSDVVFRVMSTAEREGWVADLIVAAQEAVPRNAPLHAFAKAVGLAYDTPSPEKLRSMLAEFASQFDLPKEMPQPEKFERMLLAFSRELGLAPQSIRWVSSKTLEATGMMYAPIGLAEKVSRLTDHVCRVDWDSSPMGTGFRVGPDLILTAYHCVEEGIKGSWEVEKLQFRFGYLLEGDGVTLRSDCVFRPLKSDWLVDHSPYSALDRQGVMSDEATPPDEINYALIRVDSLADHAVAGEPSWVTIPAGDIEYMPGSALHILQHPLGDPMKLAINPNSMIGTNRNRTRLFHRTWTQPGCSGAPYFDYEWRLIGFHVGRNPPLSGRDTTFGFGVPIVAVADLLRARGFGDLLGPNPTNAEPMLE